jgi:hypothetical protein
MATDIDGAPIYDPVINTKTDCLSDSWMLWVTSFVQTLQGYLSQTGIFIPQLTSEQRDTQILNPVEGQMIYNLTIISPQIWQNGMWKTFTTT